MQQNKVQNKDKQCNVKKGTNSSSCRVWYIEEYLPYS